MGWRPTLRDCWEELEASEHDTESRLRWREDAIRRFAGSAYDSWRGGYEVAGTADPENTSFQQVAELLPMMVSATPQCRLSSNRGQKAQQQALAIQAAANRTAREQRVERALERVATDMLFTWGAGKVLRSPRPGQEGRSDPLNMPVFRYIPLRWYRHDAQALDSEMQAWSADARVAYLSDLIDEGERDELSGWNLELLRLVKPATLSAEFKAGEGFGRRNEMNALDRGEVAVWEMWIRDWGWTESELDELEEELGVRPTRANGYNGALVTVLDDSAAREALPGATEDEEDMPMDSSAWIRKPRPFYGPRWGPHIQFGAYVVPDEADPLGLISATADQALELNDHSRSVSQSMRSYKRGIVFDNDEAAEQVQNMGHDNVGSAPAADFREGEGYVQFEIGGATEQQLAHLGILHERFDRNAGTDDSARGRADANATATAVATAAGKSQSRKGWVLTKFARGVEEMFRTMAWYLWHDDSVMVPLDDAAAKEMGAADPDGSGWFYGGLDPAATLGRLHELAEDAPEGSRESWEQILASAQQGADQAPSDDPISGSAFDDLEIAVELSTLRAGSPEMQQFESQQLLGGVQQSALIAQMPWVDPSLWVKFAARTMGMPEFAQIVNPEKMAKAQQLFEEALARGGEMPGDRSGLQRTGAKASPFVGTADRQAGSMMSGMSQRGPQQGAQTNGSPVVGSPQQAQAGQGGGARIG